VIDPAATHVRFELDAGLHTVHGTARVTQGEVHFDPATGAASGRVLVDARSLETGNGSRDKTMHADVLESSKFPDIVLIPEKLEGKVLPEGEADVTLSGTLEIHGGRHPIRATGHVRTAGGKLTGTAGFTVPYVAWGMKDPSVFILRVKKEVPVTLEISGQVSPHP
jgi:polyisoprenoid-binding protein YceI